MTTSTRLRPSAAMTHHRRPGRAALYVVLVLTALIIIVPFAWIFLTSFKTDFDAINTPASPWPHPFVSDAYHTLSSGQ